MNRIKRLIELRKELRRVKKIDKAVALLIKTKSIKKVDVRDLTILSAMAKHKGAKHMWFIDREVLFK